MTVRLVKPALEHLPSYVDALRRGWSPDNVRPEVTAREHLAAIDADPVAFVESLDDPEAKGPPLTLPDGRQVPRLPGYRRFIWDGEVAGSIGFRWQEGTSALPSHALGHISYAVVPWKRGRRYATRALMLDEARARGLKYVQITTLPHNIISHKVVLANGGVLMGRFTEDPAYDGPKACASASTFD